MVWRSVEQNDDCQTSKKQSAQKSGSNPTNIGIVRARSLHMANTPEVRLFISFLILENAMLSHI